MDSANRIAGERIAKNVARRMEAIGVLGERMPTFSWIDGLGIVAAVAFGIGFGGHDEHAQCLVNAAAGIGFYLGMTAFADCLRLRRRLNAAIVLLNIEDHRYAGPAKNGAS